MIDLFRITRDGDAGGAPGGGAPAAAPGAAAPAAPAPASLAAAAAAAAGPSGQPGGEPTAPKGQQPGGAPNGAYYPEGLPEQFRGANERETIDKLASELSSRPKPPASPKDYTFELSPEMKERVGDLKDDKVLPLWAETAHELGLDDKTATAVFEKLYQRMEKAGLIDQGPDYTAELAKLQPKTGTDKERALAVQKRVNDAEAFVKGMETNGALTKDLAARFLSYMDDAQGVMLVEAIAKAMGSTGMVNGGAPNGGQKSKDAIKAEMADPRYDVLSPKYDKSYQERVDREYRALYGQA